MKFNEEKHEYVHQGSTYISATTLLKKYGLSADYAGIPQDVLDRAAKKGNAVHKALELFVGGDQSMLGLLREVDLFSNYITQRGIDLTTAKAEEVVFDTQYKIAGTVDFQYQDGNDNYIADFKTTSQLHFDSVAWQLSIYNYLVSKGDMMTYYFNKLKVFHFTAGKLYVRDVYTVDYDQVKALFEANLNNQPTFNYVKNTGIVTASDETLISQLLNEKAIYQENLDKIDQELNKVLDKVKENMLNKKDYKYKGTDFTVSYRAPQHRRSLNSRKVKVFLKQHGENVDDYMNETITKDGITAKLIPAGSGD